MSGIVGSGYGFGLNLRQKAALDAFAPVLIKWREGLHSSYFEPAAGRVTDEEIVQEIARIETFARAFGIELPELTSKRNDNQRGQP